MDYISSKTNKRNPSYHDTSEETHGLATAGVGRNISIAHCEEGDGYEPQGCVHVARRCLASPAEGGTNGLSKTLGHTPFL